MYKKLVIVFEGIEGSGKTSHCNFVSNYLHKKKINHFKIREPGGSKNSEKIRNLVLDNRSNFQKNTDLLLYLASRSENIKELKKHYRKKIILIDRFTDSTIAYQHFGMNINIKIIKLLNKFITGNFTSDITFLSTVNVKNLKYRLKNRLNLNRYDKFKLNFYNKVQNGYYKISKNKKNYIIIDSNKKNISDVKKIIINKLKKII